MWKKILDLAESEERKAEKSLKIFDLEDLPDEKKMSKARGRLRKAREIKSFAEIHLVPLKGTYDPWLDPDWSE